MSINVFQLSYAHPDRQPLFNNINLSVVKGEKASLIGNNGTGKSTLLRIIAGALEATSGEIVLEEKAYYVPQHFGQYDDMTVAEALGISCKLNALHAILEGDASENNFNILDDDWNIEERTSNALALWGLEWVEPTQKMHFLSGGEKTKVFLSGIAIHSPGIILLDEPTNHLDKASRKQLYQQISESKATIIVVSHDRTLLNLIDHTYELYPDKIESYGGNYEFYKAQKEAKLTALQEELSEKEKELHKAKRTARETIERQEKHSVRGEKANKKKGVARIMMKNLKNKSEKSTVRLKEVHEDKMENLLEEMKRIQKQMPDAKELKMNISNAGLHIGKELITAKKLNFGYTEDLLWKEDLEFLIRSGDRLLLNGANGSGKTTLIRLMLGNLEPVKGTIERADFNALYVDQEYSIIDNKLTVFEQIQQFNSQNYLEHELKMLLHRFLFPVATWDKTCNKLSGGEKMKLVFCCLQASNNMPDVFILDEPTNNLDIQSIEIITSVVKNYQGTLLLISHDEYFIKEIGINQEIKLM